MKDSDMWPEEMTTAYKKKMAHDALKLKHPCVFCGKRLSPMEKKVHACWNKKSP